jgi:hypothetical protein
MAERAFFTNKPANRNHSDSWLQRNPAIKDVSANTSAIVREVISSPGQPLDTSTRDLMESRFGYDFSSVRVHHDDQAGLSAGAADALAYTLGNHIVFNSGHYVPHSPGGQRLLAHELTHFMQQSEHLDLGRARFKKKPRTQPFYQEALDELDKAKKADQVELSTGGIIDWSGRVPVIKKFIGFLVSIDREDVKGITERLDDFLEADATRLAPFFPSDALANTTITRLLLLGMGKEAQRFRGWYLKHEKESQPLSARRKDFLSERFIWEQVLEELTNRIPAQSAEPALKVLDALLLLFVQMRNEMAGLDEKAIKEDQRSRAERARQSDWSWDSHVTISVYFASLIGLLKEAFAAMQIAYQVVLDQAVEDLAAGRGPKYLNIAKDRLDSRLHSLIDPKEKQKKVGGLDVEVTRSEFKKGGGRHLDFFAKGKAAKRRAVGIEFYDKEAVESLAREKELDLNRIYLIRREQIAVLERIYGLAKDEKTGKPTLEAQENAAAIAKLGKQGLRLNSNDDWRRFLLEKYEQATAKGAKPAEALTGVIKFLESFLHAFTTHTPYNIEDFGDNYLTREFPRAMTGQLIHDCGVYALRIAYILSLLREQKDLQLRFRFIVLPVHVGLVITGKDLPAYFANNDQITEYKDIADIHKAWIRTDEKGEQRKPTGKDEETQFVAELAGNEFISGADLPFKLIEVPKPKGDSKSIKQALWSVYTKQVAPTKLFGPDVNNPKSSLYQFHLKYLEVIQLIKAHFNKWLVPFWNETAHNAWLKHEPELTKGLAEVKGAKTVEQRDTAWANYDKSVQNYIGTVKPSFDVVEKNFEPVSAAQSEIFQTLQDHPEVVAKGIRTIHSARIEEIIGTPWWSVDIYRHISDLTNAKKVDRKKVDAPFARKQDMLQPID